jgi:hypothetical protein
MSVSYWISFSISFFVFQFAQASYYVIPVKSSALNPTQRTHIVISGRGNDLGPSLQRASAAKIKKIAEVFPKDQILYITTEEKDEKSDTKNLKEMGFQFIERKSETLYPEKLMEELEKYTQIASVQIYSHGGVVAGIFLDREPRTDKLEIDIPWMAKNPSPQKLVGHFTEDAFVTLNGCNTGHVQAVLLARLWSVPVMGSLSSTHFENQFRDGKFYWADESKKRDMAKCAYGSCYRLRPDNQPYNGMWGVFQQGLSIYKFFCGNISERKCLSGMAASVAINIAPSDKGPQMDYAEYAEAVREWLCPSGSFGSKLQSTCMEKLATFDFSSSDRTYTPFNGPSPQCNFKSCYADPKCENPYDNPMCPKNLPENKTSTTFVDEYLAYLKAYTFFANLQAGTAQ